ncbi:CinA family protein [Schumannella luteola]
MKAAERLSHRAMSAGFTVAVAESLTCGRIASALGATPDASVWFLGGVVAYDNEVKYDLLGVPRGPVVSREAARRMAEGVARLTTADLAIAVTGVGGPAHAEDQPPGTVFIAATYFGETVVEQRHFPGPPERVLEATIERALELGLRASLGE